MSKRPHSPPPQVVRDEGCLSFHDWKAQQTASGDVWRADNPVYDPSTELLPPHAWYSLDQDLLRETILRMCNKLGRPVMDCQISDAEIADLLRNLNRATQIPDSSQITIAVVGNQGVGKSSTINALVNRELVDASAGSSACTAFATIIEYKNGARDDTDVSDLRVTFMEIAELREFIAEHIRRYVDVHKSKDTTIDIPGPKTVNVHELTDAGRAVIEETNSTSENSDQDAPELDMSDSDFSDTSECSASNNSKKDRKKGNKAEQKGADTAEHFFSIIFNAHQDDAKKAQIRSWLDGPNLEDGHFLEHCIKVASEHLAQIQSEEGCSVQYTNVKDSDLQTVRDRATILWPLVKAVTISTGSVLLRNGIRFMDLPGYGDLNQTRTAVVNEYRRKANFEMVVAKSDRYLSKTDEDRFLHRAIRHHDAQNVFLVLNKADSCLETPQKQVVRTLKNESEEPFATFHRYLSGIENVKGETRRTLQQYRRYLIREAQMAGGRRECDRIQSELKQNGVRVFAVSSARYFDWLDPSPPEDPPYDPEGTGIPGLRRALLLLPAEASYRNLNVHVFETVADIEDKVSRILMKFNYDTDIAGLRKYLSGCLPPLCSDLKGLLDTIPNSILPELWSDEVKRGVAARMEQHMMTYRQKHQARYSTFSLMLRNNGIATHGSSKGKNLNEELMQTYKSTIRTWRLKAKSKEAIFEQALVAPVQAALTELMQRFSAASSDPELKRRVKAALEKLTRRIDRVQVSLSEQLQEATKENYRRFTTEDDIKCPVAIELKTAYARINSIRMSQRGRRPGIYMQQRDELARTFTEDHDGMWPLVEAIPFQVKQQQCKLWQAAGYTYLSAVFDHFAEFSQAVGELLENRTYTLDEHKLLRGQLRFELVDFSKDLTLLKDQFVEPDAQPAEKKVRTMNVKEEIVE